MYNDKTFKHGQMAAILFMQMRWSIFIYELLEPQTALEWSLYVQIMPLHTTKALYVLITSLHVFSQQHFKQGKLDLLPKVIYILISIFNIY